MIDFEKYTQFVDAVTSDESKNGDKFTERIAELYFSDFDTHRALTAACGLSAESGEFMQIIKKILFQGNPVNEENLFHMKRELGDIMWYFMQACMALGTTPEEIIEMNVEKLKKRYPGGEFDVHYSENRLLGDV